MATIRVQEAPFDAGAEIAALTAGRTDIGGLGCFVGVVRGGDGPDAVAEMTLEHYPAMTQRAMERVVAEAASCLSTSAGDMRTSFS
jgi:molybdopterin synthase catalytic subunit